MASSSSTTTKESTDKQNKSNQITEIIHESSQVTSTSSPGNVDETRTDEYEYDTIRFVSDATKSSFFPVATGALRRAPRSDVSHARPFEEIAIGLSTSDEQGGIYTKPTGNTDKKS